MRIFFLILFCFSTIIGKSQEDTIRLMQYNLLNYGNFTSYCNTNNNNLSSKDSYLRTILDYVKPDVFTVNELGVNFVGLENEYGKRILDNTLNINGVTKYKKASHTGGSFLVNMLYYNSDKLVFYKQEVISNGLNSGTIIRAIDFYTLYHNDPNLATHNDTVFMTFIVAHLKAGSSQSDQDDRANAALDVMEYLDQNNGKLGNRFLMGDLNTKESGELVFSHFLTYSNQNIRFQDPINKPGYWGGNWQFKEIHTQSTHSFSANGECPIGGGLDDRFDFILASQPVMWGQNGVSYIPNSYTTLANDGTSYNSDLNFSSNTQVPSSVASALYNMSDHLPLIMDLRVSKDIVNGVVQLAKEELNIEFNNPVQTQLVVRIPNHVKAKSITLYNSNGKLIYQHFNYSVATRFEINTERLSPGIYFMQIETQEGKQGNYKVVKF